MKNIVVGSDAIFAIYNPNDSLNTQVIKTFRFLISKEFQLIYPTSVIFEVISLFQRVLPIQNVTLKLINMIKKDELSIHVVNENILKEAARLFDPKGSKKNTLIDCSVAVIAKKIKAEGVFSYDRFYVKQGLKLAEELISDN